MTRLTPISFLLTVSFAFSSFAGTPPPLAPSYDNMAVPARPHLVPAIPAKTPPSAWTRDFVQSLGLSSTVTMDILSHLPTILPTMSASDQPSAEDEGAAVAHTRRLRPESLTSVTATTYPVTNDTPQDIEPSVITNTFRNPDGTTFYRTTSVWTKETGTPTNPTPVNYWTTTRDFVNFAGYPTGQALAPVPNTSRSGDPMLSENPYLSAGVAPKRTYCSGVAYALQANGATGHTTVDVWYTDDPGSQAFQLFGGQPIAQDEAPWFFDKPSIATSWYSGSNGTPSTLGWTYVAVVHANTAPGGAHIIEVYRNTSATPAAGSFTLINNQFSGTGYESPIIVVDSNTGWLYLLWVDQNTRLIQIARSTDGSSFALVGTITPPAALITGNVHDDKINGNVTRG